MFSTSRSLAKLANRRHFYSGAVMSDRARNRIPDYYSTLGISRTASADDIKLAYFRMAKKYHPDTNRNQQAGFMFAFAAEAYEVLSDPQSREEYDRCGEVKTRTGGGTSKGPRISQNSDNADAEKLFTKIFGQERGGSIADEYQTTGEYNDDTYSGFDASQERIISIPFDDAALGCRTPIWLNIRVICPKCQGDGSELGYKSNICPYCEGTGYETERMGGMVSRKCCSYCNGTKLFIRFKCHECRGSGQTIRTFEQFIDIPPGCEDGQILRGEIHPDILKWTTEHHDCFYVKVNVDQHPMLRKEGSDILSEADVSVSQALLGGELFCTGIGESTVILNFDSLESSHSTLVAPEEGVPSSSGSGGRGSHCVTVGIKVPKRLSGQQKQKFIQLFQSEVLENGWAEGCREPDHAHKMRIGVIEPDSVFRPFGLSRKSMKERFTDQENMQGQPVTELIKNAYEKFKEFRSS